MKKLLNFFLLLSTGDGGFMTAYKLVLFDMDGTLLQGRTIFVFAEKKGFMQEMQRIMNGSLHFYERSIEIAKALKGTDSLELLDIFRSIPLQDHVQEVINELKKHRIETGIITDSYQFVAEDLQKRLGIDYVFANNLIIDEGIVTGNLEIHNTQLVPDGITGGIYSICKSGVMEHLCTQLGISMSEAIAVGDGKVDASMLQKAGLGIAFNAPPEVQQYADVSITDMRMILSLLKKE